MIPAMWWLALAGCTPTETDDGTEPSTTDDGWVCLLDASEPTPPFSQQLGCTEDFTLLASLPLDASIPGARSVKTVIDRLDENALYFQDSKTYGIHWEFAVEHLNADDGKAPVPDLGTFNQTEYYSPDRRFLLGSLTWYEGPDVWAYELAPYDASSADMVVTAYELISANTWIGDELYFHPTSSSLELMAEDLPPEVPVITTDELFDGIDYQPLNLGTTMGQLAFYDTGELRESYVNPCEIVVLDEVPNDISVVAGIITEQFQTPLAHINVLSQNRGTPNMAARHVFDDPDLRAFEGEWVQLTVDPFEWTVVDVTDEEGAAFCEASKPEPLDTVAMDLSVQELVDAEDVLDLDTLDLGDALDVAIPAFGGKASHYGGLVHIGPEVPVPDAFVIPVYFYDQFMLANGFYDDLDALFASPDWDTDPALRAVELEALQERMLTAPLDPAFEQEVLTKLITDFPGVRMRFRSSTTAEDLGSFTGAGLYESKSGDPADPTRPVADAIRTVWASVWGPRAYEERDWYGIDHIEVGMAVLVHRSFPDEEANGVAITANIFDTTGLEPGFYVNVQVGDNSVVIPDPGVVSDQFLYFYDSPGQPVTYLAHSTLIPEGETVLTNAQVRELGDALAAIRTFFFPVYGVDGGFYGMDTEFKFDQPLDEPNVEPQLFMKQARPYPGFGGFGAR